MGAVGPVGSQLWQLLDRECYNCWNNRSFGGSAVGAVETRLFEFFRDAGFQAVVFQPQQLYVISSRIHSASTLAFAESVSVCPVLHSLHYQVLL